MTVEERIIALEARVAELEKKLSVYESQVIENKEKIEKNREKISRNHGILDSLTARLAASNAVDVENYMTYAEVELKQNKD